MYVYVYALPFLAGAGPPKEDCHRLGTAAQLEVSLVKGAGFDLRAGWKFIFSTYKLSSNHRELVKISYRVWRRWSSQLTTFDETT